MMTDRGVSSAFGYVLTLAIATVLVSGLLVAGGNFVGDSRERVIRQELEVIGQHVASNIEMADRLVVAGDNTSTVVLNQSFSQRATGVTYQIELVEEEDPYLQLNATDPDISVLVNVDNSTAVRESYADGGEVAVVYDESEEELVIQNG
jgi:hypothetical protein